MQKSKKKNIIKACLRSFPTFSPDVSGDFFFISILQSSISYIFLHIYIIPGKFKMWDSFLFLQLLLSWAVFYDVTSVSSRYSVNHFVYLCFNKDILVWDTHPNVSGLTFLFTLGFIELKTEWPHCEMTGEGNKCWSSPLSPTQENKASKKSSGENVSAPKCFQKDVYNSCQNMSSTQIFVTVSAANGLSSGFLLAHRSKVSTNLPTAAFQTPVSFI